MAWNPHTDQENRAYSNILTSLFPEQTRTVPRILVWSIIFLLDLSIGIGAAAYFGLLQFREYRSQNQMMLSSGLLIAAIVGIFWLQGRIWYALAKYFQNRNKLD